MNISTETDIPNAKQFYTNQRDFYASIYALADQIIEN